MNNAVLGVSAGTRFFGYAIFRSGELTDWRLKSFPGKWSDLKLRMILRMFENMLSRNIDCVAFKINEARHSSKNLNALNSYLAKLAGQKNIPVSFYTAKELCEHYGVKNKVALISCFSSTFPELFDNSKSLESYNERSHMKLFEGIAAGELAAKQKCPNLASQAT